MAFSPASSGHPVLCVNAVSAGALGTSTQGHVLMHPFPPWTLRCDPANSHCAVPRVAGLESGPYRTWPSGLQPASLTRTQSRKQPVPTAAVHAHSLAHDPQDRMFPVPTEEMKAQENGGPRAQPVICQQTVPSVKMFSWARSPTQKKHGGTLFSPEVNINT